MKCFVTDGAGVSWQLPRALSARLEYGIGTPCDSFTVCCPWEWGQGTLPGQWVGFYAEYAGERVFTGVVDECEVRADAGGRVLELAGRGMAALLLDNEAVGEDYLAVGLEDILRRHVEPYGIGTVVAVKLPWAEDFRVETGSSEWTVLERFLRQQGGPEPRFDRQGRLVLAPWGQTQGLVLDGSVPVSALVHRDRRYGVLSEVLVRDRYSGALLSVENGDFRAGGGRARRVLTVPGRADRGEMLAAGREQLERSARELEELEITLPAPFYAMPGEEITVQRPGYDRNGRYRNVKTRVELDGEGWQSRLTLRPEQ